MVNLSISGGKKMNKLKKKRIELEMSQYQLELLSGVSQAKISLVERGFRNLNDDERRKLAKVLHLKEKELPYN